MRGNLLALLLCACPHVHAGGVYFSDRISGNQTVRAVDFGNTASRVIGSASDPRGIIFDPVTSRVYCADRGTQQLNWYPSAGGLPQTQLTNLANVADLAMDRINRVFYWCQESGGQIRKAPFAASGDALTVGQTVYSGLSSPYYLHLDLAGQRLFWSQNGVNLYSGPITGGAVPAPFFTSGVDNRGIAFDPSTGYVYWVQRGTAPLVNSGIYRRLLSGGPVETLYGQGQPSGTLVPDTPHGIILDLPAGKVYWTDTGTNNGSGYNERGVTRGSLDGSTAPEIIFPGTPSNQPWDLDLDTRTPNVAQWRARFFSLHFFPPELLSDEDLDGFLNLTEYAFGSAPVNGGSLPTFEPLVVNEAGVNYAAIRFHRRSDATDLSYRVQVSSDLTNWSDNVTTPGTTVEVAAGTPDQDGMQLVTVRSTVVFSSNTRQFFRVRVDNQ